MYGIARTPLLYVLHNELRQLERVRRALGGTRRRCATYCAERRSRVWRAVTLPALLATHLIALGPGYGEHNWYLPGSNGSPAPRPARCRQRSEYRTRYGNQRQRARGGSLRAIAGPLSEVRRALGPGRSSVVYGLRSVTSCSERIASRGLGRQSQAEEVSLQQLPTR